MTGFEPMKPLRVVGSKPTRFDRLHTLSNGEVNGTCTHVLSFGDSALL